MKQKQTWTLREAGSLALKIIVMVFAVTGTLMSMGAGRDSFMGGTSVLMYFTIQSNIGVAILAGIGAWLLLTRREMTDRWHLWVLVGAQMIGVENL